MTSVRFTKFREIDSHVLWIIQSTRRGEDISELVKWGHETGFLSQQVKSNQHVMTLIHLKCDRCGKGTKRALYWVRKALKQGSRDSYCTQNCSMKHHAIKNTKRLCPHCVVAHPMHGKRYCSEKCKVAAREIRKKKNLCPHCGEEFSGIYGRQFCSRECADSVHSLRMRGSKNSKYRGPKIAYSNQFRAMRPLIRMRDENCCVNCETIGRMTRLNYRPRLSLQVHHIDEDPTNNNPENLITMCESCHKRHHAGALAISKKLSGIATERTMFMTSRLKAATTSLLKDF